MTRRLIILCLLLFVAALLLTSCEMLDTLGIKLPFGAATTTTATQEPATTAAPVTTAPVTTTAAPVTTAPDPSLSIPYATLDDYTVIVKDGSEDTATAANELAAAIAGRGAATPSVGDELLAAGAKQIAVILPEEIGHPAMRYLDYKVFYEGDTVYVMVGSAAARSDAIAYLLSLMKNGSLRVPESGYLYFHSYAIEEIMINRVDIASYSLYATAESRHYIELLRDGIRELCGYTLPITDEQNELTIALAVDEGADSMKTTVTAVSDRITISGGGKNAMNFGVRAFLALMESAATDKRIDMTLTETTLSNTAYAAPSAGAFYNEAGELDRNGDGKIHIAFIGGSLTQTNEVWCPPVVEYFKSMFPNKTVTYTNAAIGATDSTMGAIRFAHDVLDVVSPDIVFVEYAVNDAGFTSETDFARRKNGVYIESIIRQCLEHENQPAVALLYFPRGFEPDSTAWKQWENGVALKERIAANYGIKSVNVLDYVKALYESQKAERPTLTYGEFLLQYYNPSDMVHPTAVGYAVFRDAILAALEADFEGFLTNRTDADLYLSDYKREIMTRWELLPLNDSSIELEGNIVHYESSPGYPMADPRYIPANNFEYPRFLEGVWQVESKTPFAISIRTKANVVGFYGLYSTTTDGMSVDIKNNSDTILGSATIAAPSSEHGRPYLTTFEVSESGKRMTYTISQSRGDAGTVFRAGYIVLGTYTD